MANRMDWLRMETRIRNVLRAVRDARDSGNLFSDGPMKALYAISDVLGEETGRGYIFDDSDPGLTPEHLCARLKMRTDS